MLVCTVNVPAFRPLKPNNTKQSINNCCGYNFFRKISLQSFYTKGKDKNLSKNEKKTASTNLTTFALKILNRPNFIVQ